jgi:uncharacterized membrane protein YvlD (DUF360 family)
MRKPLFPLIYLGIFSLMIKRAIITIGHIFVRIAVKIKRMLDTFWANLIIAFIAVKGLCDIFATGWASFIHTANIG